MTRRRCLKTVVLTGTAGALGAAPAAERAIQLHVDLDVDPAREKTLLETYRNEFRPAIRKQPGFVDVRLMKLVSAPAGQAPPNTNYRLLVSFEKEEQRKAWVATETHQKLWPLMEKNLRSVKYNAVLFQIV